MEDLEIFGIPYLAKGSGIHIKKENRGKFTETKKRTGKTTEELTHSKNPLTRKRAIFAQNAKKWKHEDGGEVHKPNGHRSILDNGWFKTKDLKKNHPLTYQWGGSFTTGALADMFRYFPNQVKYGNGNYNNVNNKLLSQLKPNDAGHYDDIVKLSNHPTHPSRGRFNKSGTKFYLTDFGMQNPNLTLFGTADGNQDSQTTMIYKGGVALPEITVTPKWGNYIDNTYDQIKIYPNTIKKHQQGGPFQINNSQPQVLQRYISLVNQGIPQQAAFDTSHLSMIEDGRPGKYYSFGRRASNLGGWTKNATDSLTNGRYRNLQNVQNFKQFKQGLKQKNYNTRPAFYNVEMNRGRNRDKQIINQWNKQQGLNPIAQIYNQNINQV